MVIQIRFENLYVQLRIDGITLMQVGILKSQLATQFSVWNDSKNVFWEFSYKAPHWSKDAPALQILKSQLAAQFTI